MIRPYRCICCPRFGAVRLDELTKASVQTFIARKAGEQRFDYTKGKNPNPNRPTLSGKTIRNMVAVLHSIITSVVEDYELLDQNPLDGVLRTRRRRRFPMRALRQIPRVHVLEPDDFKRAVDAVGRDDLRRVILVASLAGLRWGELVALRPEDVNWRRNRLVITRALYRRIPGAPKTEASIGEVPICPTVRRILQDLSRREGYLFSRDGVKPIGDGTWVKRQWRAAQEAAEIRTPITWHGLRHQFVSLLIAAKRLRLPELVNDRSAPAGEDL